ncbi:DUF3599 family protein [Peribacillus loiseleuriae]|uniref:DUF3599 family protein n=1 Tax=Peribacillus loiseleuriae TaxID=1679170 RepID=UPI003D0951D4
MSYKKLLTHRCDIYHLKEREVGSGGGFGVPIEDMEKEFYYDDEPDISDVHCYFTEKNQSIIQMDPNNTIFQSFLVHFLPNVDVRTNSKIVWEAVYYKAQKPRKIKNHHQEVIVTRNDNL